jgi:hypothetical protein
MRVIRKNIEITLVSLKAVAEASMFIYCIIEVTQNIFDIRLSPSPTVMGITPELILLQMALFAA